MENSSHKVIVNMSSSLTSINKGIRVGPESASYIVSKVGLNVLVGDLFINCFLLKY
ncbi:hypothetical protein BDR07DRAFT_311450 [Suillus spraguei]|nr:hypothetical protein BDR07DRAFT_311450 [Suillus spraguei]